MAAVHLAGFFHVWGLVPGQCDGTQEPEGLQGYQVLPQLLTAALAHVCGELTMAPKPQHKWCSATWPLAVSLLAHASGTTLVPG